MITSRGASRPPVAERRSRLPGAAAFLGSLLLSFAAHAQVPPGLLWSISSQAGPAEPAPPPALGVIRPQEIPPGSVIGEVRVVAKNIFDPDKPGEGNRLFHLANYLHRSTRTGVVAEQLLFKPGDVFSPELIQESARLLRTHDYLYDVDIRPILRDDGKDARESGCSSRNTQGRSIGDGSEGCCCRCRVPFPL